MKKISFIASFALILCLLAFPFSGTSVAKQTQKQRCMRSCSYQQKNCLDANKDSASCEKEYQGCVSSCESTGVPSSADQQKQQEQPVQQKQQQNQKKPGPVLR